MGWSYGQDTSPSLLVAIRDGTDAVAWETFVRIYTPLIYAFCHRWQLQDTDTAEVTQEVLSRLVRKMSSFSYEPEQGRFRNWLWVITRGEIARWLRCQRRGLPMSESLAEPSTLEQLESQGVDAEWEEAFFGHVMKMAMERVKSEVEPQTWEAFRLTWCEEVSSQEVASRLEVPIRTVYVAKSRVLKRLRQEVLYLADDLPLVLRSY